MRKAPHRREAFRVDDGKLHIDYRFVRDIDDSNALFKAILKWMYVVDRLHTGVDITNDGGITTCALCYVYRTKDDGCIGCPVRVASGCSYCHDTPYLDYLRANNIHERLMAANAQLEFLRKVRDG